MIMEELGLNHDHAQKLLPLHGPVKNAIDAFTDILKIIKISTYLCLTNFILYASHTNLINTEYDTLTIIIHPTAP